ncbi:MAG: histidinol-phosphate transaminase, partial [Candidatus Hecatellales archaeon]
MKVRELIKGFKPYEWEPSRRQISRETGIPEEEILRFDLNTVPYRPEEVLEVFAGRLASLPIHEYPDPSYRELREALSEYLGVSPENLTVTVGADEALDVMAKAFIDPGSLALISAPTYSMYRVTVEALGGSIVEVVRKPDFSDNIEALIEQAGKADVRMIFLCSPNNPTGNLTSEADAVRLLEAVDCAVMVDEAYAEFAGASLVKLVENHENLAVVRTFSKAFAMAGARIGYLAASKEMVELLNRVRPPNSVSLISLALARLALDKIDFFLEKVREVVAERDRMAEILGRLKGLTVYPSKANFLLIRFKTIEASQVYRMLLSRGMVVRRVRGPLLEN